METQQQQSVEENPLAHLTPVELGDRLASAKMAIKNAEEYISELKAELLKHLGRGEFLQVASPMVQVGDEVIQPIASITIRHKSRITTTVPNDMIIRILEASHPDEFERLVAVEEVPAHTQKTLDKKEFLKTVDTDEKMFKDYGSQGYTPGISALMKHITVSESDWIEVTGLPK